MTASPFDHPFLAPLFGDEDIAEAFSAEITLRRFRDFEIALAHAQASEGIIPSELAHKVIVALTQFEPAMSDLADGVGEDGLVVPAYVRAAREHMGPDLVAGFHQGATSQDLIDTALVQAIGSINGILSERLQVIGSSLDLLSARYGQNVLMGRTRMQAALPIRVDDRLTAWSAPIATLTEQLSLLLPRLMVLQLGGPVGDRQGFGDRGDAVAARLARALDLGNPPRAWHTTRTEIASYANWLSLVTGALGKMGQDMCLMAQNGIDEIGFSSGGRSSAMPHKQNPIHAEALVTLARFNASQLSGMHHALVHEQERSGAAWALEWMILPQMAVAAGAATRRARDAIHSVSHMGQA